VFHVTYTVMHGSTKLKFSQENISFKIIKSAISLDSASTDRQLNQCVIE